jgi:hypothetical protein
LRGLFLTPNREIDPVICELEFSVGDGTIESGMKIHELKSKVSIYRALLKGKDGTLCKFSEDGPVGISVIDDLIQALESQQKRIEALEKKIRAASKSQATSRN